MKLYTIELSDRVQTNTRVVRARTLGGAMRAFTKNWDGGEPDPWTFIITVRRESSRRSLDDFLRELIKLEPLRERYRRENEDRGQDI